MPFATLILLTSMQSLDREQVDAAHIDGAGPLSVFFFVTLPHLARPIAIVVMLETIFFLGIYAEIVVTTVGGPGLATTNLSFLIYSRALLAFDVGGASAAGGIFAIVLANIVTILFVRPSRGRCSGGRRHGQRLGNKLALTGGGLAGGACHVFPVFWMALAAFKTELDAVASPPLLFFKPTLENFGEMQERVDYFGSCLEQHRRRFRLYRPGDPDRRASMPT